MNQHGMVVHRRFLHHLVGIRRSSLFESHTGIVLVAELQVRLSEIEIGVLRQGIVGADRLAQFVDGIVIVSFIIIGDAKQVAVAAQGRFRQRDVFAQTVDGAFTVSLMIIGIAEQSVDFGIVGIVGIIGDEGFAFRDSPLIFILYKENLCDMITRRFLELCRFAQLGKLLKSAVILAVGIVDVSHVIGGGFAIGGAELRDTSEIVAGFLPITGLKQGITETIGAGFLLRSAQHINIGTVEPIGSLFIFAASEMERADAERDLIDMARIRIILKIILEELFGIRCTLFVSRASQQEIRFLDQIRILGVQFVSSQFVDTAVEVLEGVHLLPFHEQPVGRLQLNVSLSVDRHAQKSHAQWDKP